MSLLVDSGAVYALHDADDEHHHAIRRVIESEPGLLIIPAALLSEIDYLLRRFAGINAELDFLENLATGAYTLEPFTVDDLNRCRELVQAYRDLDIGLADASVISTAERLGIQKILTVDERDFRAVVSKRGPFILLPADAE